jgi:hypothetical protein
LRWIPEIEVGKRAAKIFQLKKNKSIFVVVVEEEPDDWPQFELFQDEANPDPDGENKEEEEAKEMEVEEMLLEAADEPLGELFFSLSASSSSSSSSESEAEAENLNLRQFHGLYFGVLFAKFQLKFNFDRALAHGRLLRSRTRLAQL